VTHIRSRHEQKGGHIHVRVFSGPDESHLGKCGDLVFREDEWRDFEVMLRQGARFTTDSTVLSVIPEGEPAWIGP
jgi:hypothetical protein